MFILLTLLPTAMASEPFVEAESSQGGVSTTCNRVGDQARAVSLEYELVIDQALYDAICVPDIHGACQATEGDVYIDWLPTYYVDLSEIFGPPTELEVEVHAELFFERDDGTSLVSVPKKSWSFRACYGCAVDPADDIDKLVVIAGEDDPEDPEDGVGDHDDGHVEMPIGDYTLKQSELNNLQPDTTLRIQMTGDIVADCTDGGGGEVAVGTGAPGYPPELHF